MERGFLAACKTRFRTPAQRALATHPAWSTVTTLTTDDAQVVRAAKALRVLHLRPRLLEALAKEPPLPVEALRVRLDAWPIAESVRAALRETRAFPRLTDLQVGAEPSGEPIRAEAFAWLFECPFGPALRRFAVAKDPAEGAGVAVAGWLAALPATLERASFRAYGFEVVLTREADGRWGWRWCRGGRTATRARGRRRSWGGCRAGGAGGGPRRGDGEERGWVEDACAGVALTVGEE
ncbi:MAG: hypothetical protein IPJ34_43225 [Myxococcales bacterium]|nr:hypothetical protein [Myxococcales bacterium]